MSSSKISTYNNNSNNNNFIETSEISTDTEDYYEIMKFKYKIGKKKNNNKNYILFIREISNGDIIIRDSENELYSYRIDINKEQEKEKKICFKLDNYKKEYHVNTGQNNKNEKNEKNKPQKVTEKVINNIIEINRKNEIQIFECCKDAVILYLLSIENKITFQI